MTKQWSIRCLFFVVSVMIGCMRVAAKQEEDTDSQPPRVSSPSLSSDTGGGENGASSDLPGQPDGQKPTDTSNKLELASTDTHQFNCPTRLNGYECAQTIALCEAGLGQVAQGLSCPNEAVCCYQERGEWETNNPCPIDEMHFSCQYSWECLKAGAATIDKDYYCTGDNVACCSTLDPYTSMADNTETRHEFTIFNCPDVTFSIAPVPPRIMILQDASPSMTEGDPIRWIQSKHAMAVFLDHYGFSNSLYIGYDIYPNRRDCFSDAPVVSDSAPNNGQNIYDNIFNIELSQGAPLFMALGNFLDTGYAPVFTDKENPSYLIVISGSGDSCGNETNHFPDEMSGANAAQLGTLAATLRDEAEINTIAIGFGDDADHAQLSAIAQNGGTDFQERIIATNQEELTAALLDIVNYTQSCQLEVVREHVTDGTQYEPMWEQIDLYLNGEPLNHDRYCLTGNDWYWIYPDAELYTHIQLCDETCASMKAAEHIEFTMDAECFVPHPSLGSEQGTPTETSLETETDTKLATDTDSGLPTVTGQATDTTPPGDPSDVLNLCPEISDIVSCMPEDACIALQGVMDSTYECINSDSVCCVTP